MTPFKHWLNPKFIIRSTRLFSNFSSFCWSYHKNEGYFSITRSSQKITNNQIYNNRDGPDFNLLQQKSKRNKTLLLLAKKILQNYLLLPNHHLTIIPSIDPEAQPMVVMESLMCGTPVITTNIGSITDMYPDTVGLK